MKSSISRPHIYLLVLSTLLFVFVLIFSFAVLVPSGKEYRINRVDLKKVSIDLREYEYFHDETLDVLKNLRSENRQIITAFDTVFNPQRFEKQNKNYFSSLSISPINPVAKEEEFTVYEVNTTSLISSPATFYNFLDSINKSDWIMGVDFPIDFKRDGEMIKSSFTMKVYSNSKDDNNTTASESVAK
ncbi:hypothetical protein GJV85_11090 [Sulfurimonas aquatica]|uniref:Uncharacterized protein n=1 Tax=Sulfurimonas aquatica TaxID=2672570 RepID=A0A975B1T4_9BACT|nr:hypothetical protein [Sulfurimonas aquatica]QSZ42629.1 hypothetical protein GJV85_11090 [Sulfurimonas aquatica]